jgi:hypothetical protein
MMLASTNERTNDELYAAFIWLKVVQLDMMLTLVQLVIHYPLLAIAYIHLTTIQVNALTKSVAVVRYVLVSGNDNIVCYCAWGIDYLIRECLVLCWISNC